MSLPSQIVVAIVQLLVTTLQLLLMFVAWLKPKHPQPINEICREAAGAETVVPHDLDNSPVDVEGSAIQLTPSHDGPRPIHSYMPHHPSSSVLENGVGR